GTFNLLPVTPLDGSTAILLFMSETRAQRYQDWLRGYSYGLLGLVVALFAIQYVYEPIETFAKQVLLWSHFRFSKGWSPVGAPPGFNPNPFPDVRQNGTMSSC